MSKVVIRHSKPSDLAGVTAVFEQEQAYGNTLQLPHPSDTLWEKRLNNPSRNHYSLVAVIDEEIAGQLSLELNEHPRRKHVASLGIGVSDAHTGQGVGSALIAAALDLADNWLNVRRLEIEVYSDNDAAIGLYEKFGFAVEGECKDYAFRNGRFVDALIMARLHAPDES